jgi:hypothetical protein
MIFGIVVMETSAQARYFVKDSFLHFLLEYRRSTPDSGSLSSMQINKARQCKIRNIEQDGVTRRVASKPSRNGFDSQTRHRKHISVSTQAIFGLAI